MNKFITVLTGMLAFMPTLLLAADINGQVDWAQRVTLSTPVSGVVAEVLVNPGMQVKQGDVLLKLDVTNFVANVDRARAHANKTRFALAEAKREWDRAKELFERAVLADRELKLVEIDYAAAKADNSSALAELSLATQALDDSVIKAPFNGIIIGRHVSPAETVTTRLQNVAMITMGMTGRYDAVASVDAATAAGLKNGMKVMVKTAGQETHAEIIFVAVEPDKGTYTIKAGFETDKILRIGTPATIIIP